MSQLLAEMDRMKGLAASPSLRAPAPSGAAAVPATDFSHVFKGAVDQVNALQSRANDLAQAFEMGDSKVDLTQVMVTMQKANVAFEGMTQVRNKFIDAYKEIMNMSI